MKENLEYRVLLEKIVAAMSEALQASNEIVPLIGIFRDLLHSAIPEVDRFAVNINTGWWDVTDKHDDGLHRIINDLLFPDQPPSFTPEHADEDVGERLISYLKAVGFPLELYRPPTTFHYDNSDAYLGSLIVWQKIGQEPTSNVVIETIRALEPVVKFVMTDIIARHHQANPIGRAFFYGVSTMSKEVDMSIQECRVAILQLYGLSYDQTADRLG